MAYGKRRIMGKKTEAELPVFQSLEEFDYSWGQDMALRCIAQGEHMIAATMRLFGTCYPEGVRRGFVAKLQAYRAAQAAGLEIALPKV
jgi:hypothetical protein